MLSRRSRAVVVILLSLSIVTPDVFGPSPAHAGAPDTEYSAVIGYTLVGCAVLLAGAALYQRHQKKKAAERPRSAPDSTALNRFEPGRTEHLRYAELSPGALGEELATGLARPVPGSSPRLGPILQVREDGAVMGISLGF